MHFPRIALTLALVSLSGLPVPARACGHCVEDKVAATYDYGVLTAAARQGHVVVFTEIRGPAAGAPPSLKRYLAQVLAGAAGVDPGTVRVSLDPPAASFACDPRTGAAPIVRSTRARFAAKGLSLNVIKVDRGPRESSLSASGVPR
jgi:hypothetical protein